MTRREIAGELATIVRLAGPSGPDRFLWDKAWVLARRIESEAEPEAPALTARELYRLAGLCPHAARAEAMALCDRMHRLADAEGARPPRPAPLLRAAMHAPLEADAIIEESRPKAPPRGHPFRPATAADLGALALQGAESC
jgi:hypothetical protein